MQKLKFKDKNAFLQLEKLVVQVQKEELRAVIFLKELKKQLKNQVKNGVIDDYNICFMLVAFNRQNPNNEEIILYEAIEYLLIPDHIEFVTIEWDEENHIETSTIPISYGMHCILDHSKLSLDEILTIDDVWIEMKIDYQWFTNKLI